MLYWPHIRGKHQRRCHHTRAQLVPCVRIRTALMHQDAAMKTAALKCFLKRYCRQGVRNGIHGAVLAMETHLSLYEITIAFTCACGVRHSRSQLLAPSTATQHPQPSIITPNHNHHQPSLTATHHHLPLTVPRVPYPTNRWSSS